jgi:phage gp29-like protein
MNISPQFRPVGAALPPRRDIVAAASAENRRQRNDWANSINVPAARDRMWDIFEREQKPTDVKATLAAALNGDLHQQSLLFTAMIDTWPKLQKSIDEVSRMVVTAPWKVIPYAPRGDKPKKSAERMAREIEAIVWGMKPRPERMEDGLESTISGLVRGYYYGHRVAEIRWDKSADGTWKPRCTKAVPARYYGYPYYDPKDDAEDRLMFDPSGAMGARVYEDFAPNRFLIGVHSGHDGHPSVAAPLRALVGYWLAAVYGLKWFMSFTQLYGVPWRHVEVADASDVSAVQAAMADIGSAGYVITNSGTKVNVMDAAKGGDAIPQAALLDLADRQCEQFILGQTLTSGTDGTGSRALGEVHENTLNAVVSGVADFVGGILTHQLIPAIVAVNYGERSDLPEMWARSEESKDEKAMAERDVALGITSGVVPVASAWFYERHGIPQPAAGDELLVEESEEQDEIATPQTGTEPELETEPGDDEEPEPPAKPVKAKRARKKPVKAADAAALDSLSERMKDLEKAVKEGKLIDEDSLAALLGAAWVSGAKEPTNDK